MEFYSLVNEETEELIADIIKFENNHFVAYFFKYKIIQVFISIFDLSDYMKNHEDFDEIKWKLIKDGVKELIEE